MKLKKIISGLMALTISVGYFGMGAFNDENGFFSESSITVYATSKTADEAIKWCQEQVGKSTGNKECVDFIRAYYTFLGESPQTGSGVDYSKDKILKNLPKGWTYEKKETDKTGIPHKGDILVFDVGYLGNPNGHVAIYEADRSIYSQSGISGGGDGKVHHDSYSYKTDYGHYWGYIRPNFADAAATYTVTFNANGGTCTTANKKVTKGSTYGTLPTPTKAGYTFSGWFTAATGGTKITATTTVSITANQTLYAQWAPASYTVTFNANGGTCATANKKVTRGSAYGTLPTPTKAGYSFTGWFTAATGGTKIADTTTVSITANQTLYAQWTPAKPSWEVYKFKGSGTQEDPYQISSAEELVEMQKLVNCQYYNPTYSKAYYIQTADIDLKGIEWTPIGLSYDDDGDKVGLGEYNYLTRAFSGSYDGDNHYIKNFSQTKPYHYNGLFGQIRNATIRNLVVTGKVSSSADNPSQICGGIAGAMSYQSNVINCGFIGDIVLSKTSTEQTTYCGGIIGEMLNGGVIENCYHVGSVNGNSYAGGLVGYTFITQYIDDSATSEIKNSYHAGGVVSGNNAFGICGCFKKNDGKTNVINVLNCFVSSKSECEANAEGADKSVVLIKSESDIKKMAKDISDVFVNNNSELYGGYPVFPWQLKTVAGDCNSDGEFNIADAVALQKWILAAPEAELKNWQAADLCEDGAINTFDLVMMKRLLISQK